ncbi:YecA family protein [Pseudomonas putida]|uniref:YecA family protein n=1 Tax=Pseudomonas putida TaxID=303 RepID=UPI0023662E9D|nr:SEC-C domain-containing protein [Pseudomonas putida]MDD2049694.1 SEC-C domain-containing protein [Pseudomonas putida]
MLTKPGRNAPCPCGSGLKFKRCHGTADGPGWGQQVAGPHMRNALEVMISRHQAQEFQRREQQGFGKPIISSTFHDHRLVAVGKKIHYSTKWRTFHDFLYDYPKVVLGREWWNAEINKPVEQRHKILHWATRSYEQSRAHVEAVGPGAAQPMTGAIESYMRLAYDLYSLEHAVEIQRLLIDRIKCSDNFPGALYEVRVAAALLRAGFSLDHQDETDRRSTHVEFIAAHTSSGAIYAVEAKRREGKRMNINRQMSRALSKHSDHPRLVFIDTNDARLEEGRKRSAPVVLVEAEVLLKKFELDPLAKALPEAYIIVTYDPHEHHLDAVDLPSGLLLWGFHIADLHPGAKTLLQQVEIKRRHAPVFALIESIQKHRRIPVTFDGEPDAFIGGSSEARLQVGQLLQVPGPDGALMEAMLESGVVMAERREAWCVVCSNEQRFITRIPLSDEELHAYTQHPATFFGAIDRNAARSVPRTELDWFNFLWESYSSTAKDSLIEFMGQSPDIEYLKTLTQVELATEYCARMAGVMLNQMGDSTGEGLA